MLKILVWFEKEIKYLDVLHCYLCSFFHVRFRIVNIRWRTWIFNKAARLFVEHSDGKLQMPCFWLTFCHLFCPISTAIHEKCNGRISGKRDVKRMLGEVDQTWTTSLQKIGSARWIQLLGWRLFSEWSFKKGPSWNPSYYNRYLRDAERYTPENHPKTKS